MFEIAFSILKEVLAASLNHDILFVPIAGQSN
jgi:hypothetical protein